MATQQQMTPEQMHERNKRMQAEQEATRRKIREASVTQAVKDEHMRMISKDEARISAFAADRSSPTRPTLPEPMFRENFLPIMTGEAFDRLPPGMTKDELSNQAHSMWLRVSGSPTNEVDVLEADGSVAFTVPPLSVIRHADVSTPEDGIPMKAYAKAHADRAQSSPAIANAYMRRGMAEKIAHLFGGVDTKAELVEQEKKMEKVREYYGIKKSDTASGGEARQKDAGPGSLDEMSYDD